MPSRLLSLLGVLGLLVSCQPTSPAPEGQTVTFAIDMNPAIEAGWLNPDSEAVGLRGALAPLSWSATYPAEDPDGDGVFEARVTFSTNQPVLDYKVKVDGTENPNDGWEGGSNRTVDLSAAPLTVSRRFGEGDVPATHTLSGDIRTHEAFRSAHLDRPRNLYVYLPPGYEDDPERRFPVLYMHDGNNIFDAFSAGQEWQMDEHAERLIGAGELEPMIIVGVSNTADRLYEYTPTAQVWHYEGTRQGGPNTNHDGLEAYTGTFQMDTQAAATFRVADAALQVQLPGDSLWNPLDVVAADTFRHAPIELTLSFVRDAAGQVVAVHADRPTQGGWGPRYGRMLVEEVKPFIDETYRTRPGMPHTALGGSSLGGLITMHLGLQYPDVFGHLLVVSPSVWWDNRIILQSVEQYAEPARPRIWLDMGTGEGDGMVDGARALRDLLESEGWTLGQNLIYVEAEGAPHNERAWADRADDMLRFVSKGVSP